MSKNESGGLELIKNDKGQWIDFDGTLFWCAILTVLDKHLLVFNLHVSTRTSVIWQPFWNMKIEDEKMLINHKHLHVMIKWQQTNKMKGKMLLYSIFFEFDDLLFRIMQAQSNLHEDCNATIGWLNFYILEDAISTFFGQHLDAVIPQHSIHSSKTHHILNNSKAI